MPRAKNPKENDPNDAGYRSAALDVSEEFIAKQKEKDWPVLEPQYRAFAEEYCFNGYDHRAAAEAAGLNANRGIKLKRDPIIRAFIAHVQNRLYEANIVTRDFVDARLDELYDMAIGAVDTDHIDSKAGVSFPAKKFHGSLALDILKEKAKLNGVIQTDINDEDGTGTAEIHFHVKESKKGVKVTRGKRKSNDK